MKPRLSIIIPIYNVEKYIGVCLKSILNQISNSQLVEIVLINDGTNDRSAQIAQSIINNVNNATIYNQENQGLSMARNNGLKLVKGDYVWFVDSDDSICNNCIDGILKNLNDEPDMLQLNYQITYEDDSEPIPVVEYCSDVISGKEAIIRGRIQAPAQFTIFRRQFLEQNNLHFVAGIYHEDSEFKPRATYLAKLVKWHRPIVYNYLQRSTGSITSSFKLKNGIDLIKVVNNLHKFYIDNVIEDSCISGICRCISTNVNSVLLGIRSLNKEESHLIIKELGQQKHIFKDMIKSRNIKFILEGIILYLNTPVGIKLHSLLR